MSDDAGLPRVADVNPLGPVIDGGTALGTAYDLAHHGDAETGAGLVDLAVNVRSGPPPQWLAAPLRAALEDLARYPDPGPARDLPRDEADQVEADRVGAAS